MQIVQFYELFHLQQSDLRSDWYSLSGSEIRANSKGNLRVFNSNSRNIGPIANLTAGGERAVKSAQSTYWSCHSTIRTQIRNCSQNCELEMPGFGVKTGPFPTVRVFRVVRPIATVQFRVEPDLELTWQFEPVASTRHGVDCQFREQILVGQ